MTYKNHRRNSSRASECFVWPRVTRSVRRTDGKRRIEFQGKRKLFEWNFALKWRMNVGHVQGVSSGWEMRGDSSWLSSEEPVGRRERRQTGGKGRAPPSPGDKLERSPRSEGVVWKTRSTISNWILKQTGQSVRSLRCTKCQFSLWETKSELLELLWRSVFAAPQHLCAVTADNSVPKVCIYVLGKTMTLRQRQSPYSWEQMWIKHSVFNAVPHTSAVQQFVVVSRKDVQVQPADSLALGALLVHTQAGLLLSVSGRSLR